MSQKEKKKKKVFRTEKTKEKAGSESLWAAEKKGKP